MGESVRELVACVGVQQALSGHAHDVAENGDRHRGGDDQQPLPQPPVGKEGHGGRHRDERHKRLQARARFGHVQLPNVEALADGDLGAVPHGVHSREPERHTRDRSRQFLQRHRDLGVHQARPGYGADQKQNREPGDPHHAPAAQNQHHSEENHDHRDVFEKVILAGPDAPGVERKAPEEDAQAKPLR